MGGDSDINATVVTPNADRCFRSGGAIKETALGAHVPAPFSVIQTGALSEKARPNDGLEQQNSAALSKRSAVAAMRPALPTEAELR